MTFTKPVRVIRQRHKDTEMQLRAIRTCQQILPSFVAILDLFHTGYDTEQLPTSNRTVEWWLSFRNFLITTRKYRTNPKYMGTKSLDLWKLSVMALNNAQGLDDYQPKGFKQIDWGSVILLTEDGQEKKMFTKNMLNFFDKYGLR